MPSEKAVYVAIELSLTSWLVAARVPGIEKPRLHRLEGGDAAALLKTFGDLRSKASAKLGCAIDVVCCFEAGRDGFWLHRLLTAHGIATYVLEPTYPGEPVCPPGQNRPARRGGYAARARHLAGWRSAGVQHGAGADIGRGGCQATAP